MSPENKGLFLDHVKARDCASNPYFVSYFGFQTEQKCPLWFSPSVVESKLQEKLEDICFQASQNLAPGLFSCFPTPQNSYHKAGKYDNKAFELCKTRQKV